MSSSRQNTSAADMEVVEFEEANGPKVKLVTEARHTFGNRAAAQLWRKLGLPEVPAMLHEPAQSDFMF